MEHESIVVLAKGLTMAIGGMFPALAIGKLVAKAMEAIGRNPEASDKLFVPMLLGAATALREALGRAFGLDPARYPERARLVHDSHLARARWMMEAGHEHLLRPRLN